MIKQQKQGDITKEKKDSHKEYIFAVGRRKAAVARVRLYPKVKAGTALGEYSLKSGDIFVNGKPIDAYFRIDTAKSRYTDPFRITNTLGTAAATIKVEGGGRRGQLDAAVMGIARALSKYNKKEFRSLLKKKGLLTRDPRVRERRKIGTGGKARRKKQSPKR